MATARSWNSKWRAALAAHCGGLPSGAAERKTPTTRSVRPPVPYTVDKLGKDFAKVRKVEFPGDWRQLQDFRRSGAVEAKAGRVDLSALGDKVANSIDSNKFLQSTYLPPDATVVRLGRRSARPRPRTDARQRSEGEVTGNEQGRRVESRAGQESNRENRDQLNV